VQVVHIEQPAIDQVFFPGQVGCVGRVVTQVEMEVVHIAAFLIAYRASPLPAGSIVFL
jgi:hypothetical protein